MDLYRLERVARVRRELEKTVALLKKVVERLQQENATLKKAPGPVSQEAMQLIKRENEGLKVICFLQSLSISAFFF